MISVMIFSLSCLGACRVGDLTACSKLIVFASHQVLTNLHCSSFNVLGAHKSARDKMCQFASPPLVNNFAIPRLVCLVYMYKKNFIFSIIVFSYNEKHTETSPSEVLSWLFQQLCQSMRLTGLSKGLPCLEELFILRSLEMVSGGISSQQRNSSFLLSPCSVRFGPKLSMGYHAFCLFFSL